MTDARSPIVILLAHVDHGKTSILDQIRGTAVAAGEAGGITQAIGASIIPLDIINKVCGSLLGEKTQLKVAGLLFIDSPGHAAFTNLRKRGGNLADIAILVVDINEGLKPQTVESLEILKNYKTPFIVAANKVDLITGWQPGEQSIMKSLGQQSADIVGIVEKRLYELVGQLHEHGFESERFDRVQDYTKQIALVPVSAKTGQGIPELLMALCGITQKYMSSCLDCDTSGPAQGTILEAKESTGLGLCLDVIIYNGHLKKGDTIVFGTNGKPVATKVRALLEPNPLGEMRDKKTKFQTVDIVRAATGVKISAPELDNAVAGMPLRSCSPEDVEKIKAEISEEIAEVTIETDDEGVVVKADNIGSLEALVGILKEKEIPIRKAAIGGITKNDLLLAQSNYEKQPLFSVVLGFNVDEEFETPAEHAKIISNNVIYKLIEDFEKWQEEEKKRLEAGKLEGVTRPCKIEILQGYVFRQSNPAVVGCEVMAGTLKAGMPLLNNKGQRVTEVKSLQLDKKSVSEGEKGKQLAVAMPNVTVGRQINEGDTLYSYINEEEFRKIRELKEHLKPDEKMAIKEIIEIMRANNALWGV